MPEVYNGIIMLGEGSGDDLGECPSDGSSQGLGDGPGDRPSEGLGEGNYHVSPE